MAVAVSIENLSFHYPATRQRKEPRIALDSLNLQIQAGEFFCMLGPNGSGKSTLFRVLTTLIPPTSGNVKIFEHDLSKNPSEVRKSIGVVFQHPGLDKKLTVSENLLHQGHLYGLTGKALRDRSDEMLKRLGMIDRRTELVEHLSGGMQRRVELAKGLLHQPKLLLLDEPSTGLDPGARIEFDHYLKDLQSSEGVTILLTTHLLDEAEKCDRIAILDKGKLVSLGTPAQLQSEIGGDVISIVTDNPGTVCGILQQEYSRSPIVIDETVRLEMPNGHSSIPRIVELLPGKIRSITFAKPTLEDVFIHKTGRRFWHANESASGDHQ